MCRRRWKQIVDLYIRSDHAESMRKRNSIVFGMVEQEEEYVKHLSALVTLFLRPFRMAASSKKPPIMHEDVNSIFLNRSVVFQRLHSFIVNWFLLLKAQVSQSFLKLRIRDVGNWLCIRVCEVTVDFHEMPNVDKQWMFARSQVIWLKCTRQCVWCTVGVFSNLMLYNLTQLNWFIPVLSEPACVYLA